MVAARLRDDTYNSCCMHACMYACVTVTAANIVDLNDSWQSIMRPEIIDLQNMYGCDHSQFDSIDYMIWKSSLVATVDPLCLATIRPDITQGCHWPLCAQNQALKMLLVFCSSCCWSTVKRLQHTSRRVFLNAPTVVVQGVLLHLGYDGWWEQDMQELPLKRMSDAKVPSCSSCAIVF